MGSRHPARRRGYSERLVGVREPLERFLIVCEGEKTEPNYFRSFRVPREVVEVHGIGDNTVGVVQRAIELRDGGDFDQVWCVFDRDSFPAERFNAALELARTHGIEVAYSNEAFELWYLLRRSAGETTSIASPRCSATGTRRGPARSTTSCGTVRAPRSGTRSASLPCTSHAAPRRTTPPRRCTCWSGS